MSNIKPKIGITINYANDVFELFRNGIVQNAIFFYDLLTNIDQYDVHFIIDHGKVEYLDEMKYKYVKHAEVTEFGFNLVFTLCFRLSVNEYQTLKKNGTKNIFYNCGNLYILESEACLYTNTNKTRTPFYQTFPLFDACWNIPQVSNTNHYYLKTLMRCDVIEIPFIWSPKLIDQPENRYIKRSEIKSIAIFEPNLSIMKWSFPALLVCENAYRDPAIKNKVKNVYVTNCNTFNKDTFIKLIDTLNLRRDNKITCEGRHRSLYLMTQYADIAVSHTWENYLNYLYFDIAWMGWPILHNGEFCKDVGYYYDKFNYEAGGEVLKDIILNHDDNSCEYLTKNRANLQKYLPTNPELQEKYHRLISAHL